MPYYMNPGMLALQYGQWASWSDKLKAQVSVIIVDDGSPEPAVYVPRPEGLPHLSIYRVLKDMPWHQHGARNLGADRAPKEGWLLLTDMDHVLNEVNASKLIKRFAKLDMNKAYMLGRVEANTGKVTTKDGVPKPHPNSFVMTRDTYWEIGGYDEDYCGIYGTDSMYRERVLRRAGMALLSDIQLVRYWNDLVHDASTRTLKRKEGRDPEAKKRVAAAKAARGEGKRIKTLAFEWTQVY